MFESLKQVPPPTAVGAAYQAMRLLQRRPHITKFKISSSKISGRKISRSRISYNKFSGGKLFEMKLAKSLVREITAAEGKPVTKLSEEDVSKYIVSLGEAAQNVVRVVKTHTPEETKRLIGKLEDVKPRVFISYSFDSKGSS